MRCYPTQAAAAKNKGKEKMWKMEPETVLSMYTTSFFCIHSLARSKRIQHREFSTGTGNFLFRNDAQIFFCSDDDVVVSRYIIRLVGDMGWWDGFDIFSKCAVFDVLYSVQCTRWHECICVEWVNMCACIKDETDLCTTRIRCTVSVKWFELWRL